MRGEDVGLESSMARDRLGDAPPSTAARGLVQKMRTLMLRFEDVEVWEEARSSIDWKRGVMRVTSPEKRDKDN